MAPLRAPPPRCPAKMQEYRHFLLRNREYLIINLYICIDSRCTALRPPTGTGHTRASNGRFPPRMSRAHVMWRKNATNHPETPTNQNFNDMLTLRIANHSCQWGEGKKLILLLAFLLSAPQAMLAYGFFTRRPCLRHPFGKGQNLRSGRLHVQPFNRRYPVDRR